MGDALGVLVWGEFGLGNEGETNVFSDGEEIEEGVVLKDVAAFCAEALEGFGIVEGGVLVGERARIRFDESDEEAEENGFA